MRDEANTALVQRLQSEADERLHSMQASVEVAIEQQRSDCGAISGALDAFIAQKAEHLQAVQASWGCELCRVATGV